MPLYLGLVADGDTFPRKGKFKFADNQLNPATGTIRVRGVFENKNGRLTPGQFARVKVAIGASYDGLLLADSAIGIDQGQKYVLIVNSENKAEYRKVRPSDRLEGDLRVFGPNSNLKAGEWVIVNGVQRVRPGIEVKAEKVDMPTLFPAEKKDAAKN